MNQHKFIYLLKKKSLHNLGLVVLLLVVAACNCDLAQDRTKIDENLVGDWQAQEFIGSGGDALNIVHQMRLEKDGSITKTNGGDIVKGRWWVSNKKLYYTKDDTDFYIGEYSIDGDAMLTVDGKRKLVWHRQ